MPLEMSQAVDKVFGMLFSRYGIYWRHMRVSLQKVTLIIGVTLKSHNFIVKISENDEFEEIVLLVEMLNWVRPICSFKMI